MMRLLRKHRVATPVVCFVFFLIAIAAYGGSGDKSSGVGNAAPKVATPLGCLQEAGLSNVEQRMPTFWRGDNLDPFFMVHVDRLPSYRAAAQAVHDADLVWAAQSGRYFVAGPSKSVDDQGLVGNVASCLSS
jgi:hypothetical protein